MAALSPAGCHASANGAGSAAATSSPQSGTSGTAKPSASAASGSPSTLTDRDGCPTALSHQNLTAASDTGDFPVEVLGTGPDVVILSNESGSPVCPWMTFATSLVSQGYRVAIWDYAIGLPVDQLIDVVKAVRAGGAHRVVLLGASEGAKVSLIAARSLEKSGSAPADAVVSLSAEAILRPGTNVAAATRGLATPALLVTATDDPYGSADALGPIETGLKHPTIVRVPGSEHGTALLGEAAVVAAVRSTLQHAFG